MKIIKVISVVFLTAGIAFTGCDEGIVEPDSQARLAVSISAESGVLQKVADQPDSIEAVYLVITGADIKPEDGMWESLDVVTDTVDLVVLAENGLSEILIDDELEAGSYGQIRLYFSDSKVVINGEEYDLFVPSGLQTGYKLTGGFELEAGESYEIHIDFDIEKSIVKTGSGKYILKPTTKVSVTTE